MQNAKCKMQNAKIKMKNDNGKRQNKDIRTLYIFSSPIVGEERRDNNIPPFPSFKRRGRGGWFLFQKEGN